MLGWECMNPIHACPMNGRGIGLGLSSVDRLILEKGVGTRLSRSGTSMIAGDRSLATSGM